MHERQPTKDSRLAQAQDQFVLEWGRMSSSWGINRTMAQIHALLLATGDGHSVDDLIERLHISRGNASMTLRDLIDWGVVQRYRNPGDRKDIYRSTDDVFHMFGRVVRERKRREIDPTIAAIRECLAMVPEGDTSTEAQVFRDRLTTLLEVFGIIDTVYQQVFESDETFRSMVEAFGSGKGSGDAGTSRGQS
ncbi:MAG: MarR family transcriptional regulator [Fimbriimonadaceae bacterium]|nr:MarR family transcriptional regulator [Fimbriimonadaceae bacterium]